MHNLGIRTDLAIDSHRHYSGSGVEVVKEKRESVNILRVNITTKDASERLFKPIGEYITLMADNILYDTNEYNITVNLIKESITRFSDKPDNVLVAGLGNRAITADSLGPEVVSRVFVTNHIKGNTSYDFSKKFGRISAIAPGVLGTTGIETADILRGIIKENKPELVIAVDAFASSDAENLATTIQISNTGLIPGGGVNNRRNAIDEINLGVPVIAIGVPTVVDTDSLSCKGMKSYFVTPKDIDLVIDRMGKTIANGINTAVHRELTVSEIESFVG